LRAGERRRKSNDNREEKGVEPHLGGRGNHNSWTSFVNRKGKKKRDGKLGFTKGKGTALEKKLTPREPKHRHRAKQREGKQNAAMEKKEGGP